MGACGSESSNGNGAAGAASSGTGGSGTGVGLCPEDPAVLQRPASWTLESHCPGVATGYAQVFDASVVRQFTITVSPENYAAQETFIRENYAVAEGNLDELENPPWVEATVSYNGQTWEHVGFRFKGNASLKGAWLDGIRKLSFKLRFDEYEAEYPEYADQRFFGFKLLNFGNAYKDPSYIRDKTAGDLFRAAGVLAARASFAAVYIDQGEGPVYRGLYTVIEDPANQMLDEQLGDSSGNLYKPWGDPARWLPYSEVGETNLQKYFEKENNEDAADWSDIIAALTALHADSSDPVAWRAGLEATFDVPAFLRAMATNQVMVNWDSYGCKPHNYYVYATPSNGGRLRWIPWDLNEALTTRSAPANCRAPGSLLMDEIVAGDPAGTVDTNWPLVALILGDDTYRQTYVQELRNVFSTVLDLDSVAQQIHADYALIAPYVVGPIAVETKPYRSSTPDEFNAALTNELQTGLVDHVNARRTDVATELAGLAP